MSVLWGGKARGKWRPEPIRPLRLGEWLPQPPAERHDRDGTSTHNPQCSPRYCCRLTFLWLAIPLLRASRKDIAHDEWSHRLASATTGASGDIVLTQGALFAPVAACDVNQRVETCLGRACRAFVCPEWTLFRCATSTTLARFEPVDLTVAVTFVLTQGTMFAPAAVCGVNQRVELVLNVLGKLWFIWSGRRSGELRPVRSLVFSGMI